MQELQEKGENGFDSSYWGTFLPLWRTIFPSSNMPLPLLWQFLAFPARTVLQSGLDFPLPPSFPIATAAGFFVRLGLMAGGASPVVWATTLAASWFWSFGVLERLGIPRPCTPSGKLPAKNRGLGFKLFHYPRRT
jgi:hypothetical protein